MFKQNDSHYFSQLMKNFFDVIQVKNENKYVDFKINVMELIQNIQK
jgi:hypothetical protein